MRAPFMLLAGFLVAFAVSTLFFFLSWLHEGCASVETKAEDVATILLEDAVCVGSNLFRSDVEIVNRCAPAPTAPNAAARAVTIEKYVYYCRHPEALDGGAYTAGDGPKE